MRTGASGPGERSPRISRRTPAPRSTFRRRWAYCRHRRRCRRRGPWSRPTADRADPRWTACPS